MAARTCPKCLKEIPAGEVVARTNDLVCPGCSEHLGVSRFSRNLAAFAGLAVGVLVYKFSGVYFSSATSSLGWVLPIVFGYLGMSVSSPIFLFLLGDLHVKPREEVVVPHHETSAHHSSH